MLILGIIGAILALGSFVFAIYNISFNSRGNFDNVFRHHGIAMIGFFLGGIMTIVGFVGFAYPHIKGEVKEIIHNTPAEKSS